MQKESIYLFGQHPASLDALQMRLMTEGYAVSSFNTYPALAKSCEQNTPDLIILTEIGQESIILEMCMRLRDLTSAILFVISSHSADIEKISDLPPKFVPVLALV